MSNTQTTEQYIIDEAAEINLGEAPGWLQKFFAAFPALKYRNYQLYFGGQLISLVGTWIQMVALGWLVLKLTHSAFLIGMVAALGSLPVLIFSLIGGVIVDRFPKKEIIIFTESFLMVLALLLGFLTIFNLINIPWIIVIAILTGVITAVDMPARQAFAIEMVGTQNLASAIALNSGLFNAARVIGPALAGVLIAVLGIGGAFIINGASFIAVLIALVLIKTKSTIEKIHPHPLKAIKEGVMYAYSHTAVKKLLVFAGITSIFGWSYATLMPLIVEEIFQGGADILGFLYAATGFGAFLGAALVSAFAKRFSPWKFILGGNLLFCFGIIVFSLLTNAALAAPFLFLAGFGLIMQFAMINTTIQHLITDNYRGRVMSIYTLMFLGMMPVGSFEIGFVAEYFGSMSAIRINAVVVLIFAVWIYLKRQKNK